MAGEKVAVQFILVTIEDEGLGDDIAPWGHIRAFITCG